MHSTTTPLHIILTYIRPDIFDEYTRRQYIAKAPSRNPFGDEEEPLKFNDFDIFTKIRVLQQLSTWTLGNASRIREMMPDDEDHLSWRMEPLGWDKEDRAYFVLDDNRLYRRTDEPPPPPTPKVKPKKKAAPKKRQSRGTRQSKRRKVEETSEDEAEEQQDVTEQEDTVMTNGDVPAVEEEEGYGFTNKTWECIAITLEEYNDFLATIFRSRDGNEKLLRKRIEEDVLPIIEKRAEALRAKEMKRLRELENLQKMASAKRSGRLAEKAERERQEREEREAEEKKQADLRMAHEEQERQRRIEEGHESRRLTREQRLKDREVKRILHEEELARLEDDAARASSQDPVSDAAADGKRISERQIKTQRAQHKKELEKLAEDEDKWYFDCSVCGMHGENLDDGSHSVACERCDVWQHSKCHNFSPKQVEKDGFHFVCAPCKRKEEDAKKPKIPTLKLKKKESASPEAQRPSSRPSSSAANGPKGALPDHIARQLDGGYYPSPHQSPATYTQLANGPSLSPFGQAQGPPGYRYPPVGNFAPGSHHAPPPQQPWSGSPLPPPRPGSSGYAQSPPPPMANGYGSPPQHQYQHQNMHHNAVAASGGHPPQHSPYQGHAPPNGYSPRAPGGMYPMTQPPPQQPPQYQQHPNYQRPPQPPPAGGHLMNGFQSPSKGAAQAVPPQQRPPQQSYSYNGVPHYSPQHPSQRPPSHSPNTHFVPPDYRQMNAQSPKKASPAPNAYQQHPYQRPLAPSPAPQNGHHAYPGQVLRPGSANGIPPQFETPQQQPQRTPSQQGNPSPAGANSNHVAADGMSGPWPEGSKAIPQKHDRSPAPLPLPAGQSPHNMPPTQPQAGPTLHQTPGASPPERRTSQGTQANIDSKAAAPAVSVPPVALSPSQQQVQQAQMTGPATVPVKKMPGQSPQPNETVQRGDAGQGTAMQASADTSPNPAAHAANAQATAHLATGGVQEQKPELNGTAESKVEQTQTEQQTAPPAQPEASTAQT